MSEESTWLSERSAWPYESHSPHEIRLEARYLPPFNRRNAYGGFLARSLLAVVLLKLFQLPCFLPVIILYCWLGAAGIMGQWRWLVGEPLVLLFKPDALIIEGGLFGAQKTLNPRLLERFYLSPHYHYQYLRQNGFACAWHIHLAYGEQRWPLSEHAHREEAEQLQIRLVRLLQALRQGTLFAFSPSEPGTEDTAPIRTPGLY